MNSQTVLQNSEPANPANINKRIIKLLDTVRNKVRNFTVIDREGELVGEVRELVLDDQNRLNLVIFKQVNQKNVESGVQQFIDRHNSFLLRSQRIKKIDHPTKSIFIDLEKSEIENMSQNLETEKLGGQIQDGATEPILNGQIINGKLDTASLSDVGEDQIIRLLEERLVINSSQRKVGDVIVRKEIETRMVQVPVRREKLIVEQVSPEYKQLAEIDLGQAEISGIELTEGEKPEVASFDDGFTVSGLFSSPKIASLLLNAIALEQKHGCKQVRVTIVVEDQKHRQKYEEWFDRCSIEQQPQAEQ